MFNIDELTIIKMYRDFTPDRTRILATLNDVLPLIDDLDVQKTVESTIRKIIALTDETFSKLDLSDTLLAI